MAHSDRDPRLAKRNAEKSRRRWSLDEATRILAALKASGLTLAAFAAREGLQPQRLYKWRRHVEEQATPLKFAEVLVSGAGRSTPAVTGSGFEVVLRSGRILRVGASFDGVALSRLVSVLDGESAC